jgi:3D (Asp-Asp-Asp) domain-containing protein
MLVGANSSKMGTKYLFITLGFAFLFAARAFARDESLLARVTVYWPGEGQLRACSNGARLRTGHCAVDPKRIPYGSRVLFPDAACLAVDSGPAVISRKAARLTGHTASQRNAIVIDRFFESKEAALSWERSHPHFMTVRVVAPGSGNESKESGSEIAKGEPQIVPLPETKNSETLVNADGTELVGPVNPVVRAARRGAL